jgi:hypothetical protein
MENEINIAELLKDCPKGMELYSPLCGKCVFDRLNMGTIICKKQNTQEITFTSKGYYMLPVFDDCECMIFPSKDQRDWSKFQRPFNVGDIVYTIGENIAILGDRIGEYSVGFYSYCGLFNYEFDERCVYPCPEIHQVLKWLREEKKIHIGIVLTPMDLYKPVISICKVFGDSIDDISPRCFYEEAAIAGIEYVIDNLI